MKRPFESGHGALWTQSRICNAEQLFGQTGSAATLTIFAWFPWMVLTFKSTNGVHFGQGGILASSKHQV